MRDDTLHSELHDAKEHAKEAARSTLLAMRSALDFALSKLDDQTRQPAPKADADVAPFPQHDAD